ncbi:MAG: 3-phosphoshikimate 1-carboxyvinyltransferase, partial [Bacteroidota bacterium]
TRALMAHFGVSSQWEGATIVVPEQSYNPGKYQIESDWSAASYWYSMAALSDSCDILLKGLRDESWQGDRAIADIMEQFGVQSTFGPEGVRLQKAANWQPPSEEVSLDFTAVPDLAQTIAVVSAATGIPVYMTGLHTLRVKETDRIAALQNELSKLGVAVEVDEQDHCRIRTQIQPKAVTIDTYDDHRMAMAFAPLVLKVPELSFREPDVVQKSYPSFWEHMKLAGFRVNEW